MNVFEFAMKMEKDGELSQDEQHMWGEEVQSMTDEHIQKIDDLFAQKEEEIMQV